MVNRDCLLEVLKKRDFKECWILWIERWLKLAKIQTIVNGEIGKEIVYRKGL